jgi:hypothetical protein
MTQRAIRKLVFILLCLVAGGVCLAAASFLSSERGLATSHLYQVLTPMK